MGNDEQEWENFYAGMLQMTKEDSWQRIFDWKKTRDPEWDGSGEQKLQGVTGRIDLRQVKKVEHFVTRKNRDI